MTGVPQEEQSPIAGCLLAAVSITGFWAVAGVILWEVLSSWAH